jgi:hypothetical protein
MIAMRSLALAPLGAAVLTKPTSSHTAPPTHKSTIDKSETAIRGIFDVRKALHEHCPGCAACVGVHTLL